MKEKHTIKRRNRDAGQIDKLAQKDPMAAREIALYGRSLSDVEREVCHYFFREKFQDGWHVSGEDLQKVEKKLQLPRSEYFPIGIPRVPEGAQELCAMFIDAVNRRDGKMIRAIASAVDKFRFDPPEADGVRAKILDLKASMEMTGKTMTRKQLAKRLNYEGHDLSPLSRLAKTYGLSLAKDKIGRPKKGGR